MKLDVECICFRSETPEREKPAIPQPWAPSAYTAFKILLSFRLCAAIWSNISDCDETFNYWEPVSFAKNVKTHALVSQFIGQQICLGALKIRWIIHA